MIRHHPTDELLLEYAAGTAAEPEALLVACHLTLCPTCRAVVEAAHTAASALAGEAVGAVADDVLATTLARLDEPEETAPPRIDPDGVLPPR